MSTAVGGRGLSRATVFFGVLAISAFGLVWLRGGRAGATDNPIVVENSQSGSFGWMHGPLLGDDTNGQIKGYWSAASVKPSETITLYVKKVDPLHGGTLRGKIQATVTGSTLVLGTITLRPSTI